jgi:nitroreductase
MQNLLELIKSRRSIREYKNKTISRDIIENILDAGRWAPSAHNLQPWRFVVVENKEKVTAISDIMNKKADALFSGFNIVMRDTAKKIGNANVLFIVYSDNAITKKFNRLGPPYSEIASVYEIQSVANAIENMLLYIHEVGLGAAWYGMALFCEKEINGLLKQKNRLLAVLSIGYPEKSTSESSRKELVEIAEFII